MEKESLKPGVKASGVMDGESGESIEENVPVVGAGVLESERVVRGCRRETGS